MTPATAYFDKGAVVEEWSDAHFFRPIGFRITKALSRTPVTPDQITVVALITGLVAGHLLFYNSVRLNALGVALFVISDIFDSVDGQLARMRGTSSRFGRMLDGMSDNLRFSNMYIQLTARMIVGGMTWWVVLALAVATGMAHVYQSTAVDFIKQLYLHIARNGDGELELPEDLARVQATSAFGRFQLQVMRPYVAREARLLPHSVAIVRQLRASGTPPELSHEWARLEHGPVRQCAWIAQNIRFLLLAVTVVPGWPVAFFVVTLVPMSLVLIAILTTHERRAALLLAALPPRLAEAA